MGGLKPHRTLILVAIVALSSVSLLGVLAGFEAPMELELLFLFIVTTLSHMTVVARDLFVPLFLSLTPRHNPLLLGLISGSGGSIGNLAPYYLGRGIAQSAGGGGGGGLESWIRRYGLIAVFLVSVTPLPDTPVILLSGSSGLPLRWVILVQWVGKMILYVLGAAVGGFIFEGLSDAVGGFYASTLIVTLSILFCILSTWRKGREAFLRLFRRPFT
ncbi:MAG: hypothetical protein QW638_02495 [Candidatus Bathyarchaeia archaeon]|nr:hypothetical protein [Candidatus Bathyarchaeota archaeon]